VQQDPLTGRWYRWSGKEWVEVQNAALAEEGDTFVMRDENVYKQQHNPRSSDQFLRTEFLTPPDQRQMMRRQNAIRVQVEELVRNMATPPSGPTVRSISDNLFFDLMRHPEAWESEGFTPLVEYAAKMKFGLPGQIRPMYKGEVGQVDRRLPDGTREVFFLVLEEGKGQSWKGADLIPVAAPPGPPPTREEFVHAQDMLILGGVMTEEERVPYEVGIDVGAGPDQTAVQVVKLNDDGSRYVQVMLPVDQSRVQQILHPTPQPPDEGYVRLAKPPRR
jgi:hypothetical protein